jgi:hypothetical protein
MSSSRRSALRGAACWVLGGSVLVGSVLAGSALGQPAEPERPTGWYTVRPGDTLRSLSLRLSGQEALWEANWRLNPSLANPHRLTPGERLRLYLGSASAAAEVARITVVQRQVDQRPEPNPWGPALVDEVLQDRDAVRTRERSSTALRFGDGTVLAVSAESLVYLRRSAKRLEGVTRREIEIVAGRGELEGQAKAGGGGEIDLVLGQARAEPQAVEPGGRVRARARRPQTGGAQVMMYEGRGKVSASGASVEVARGMGTNVPEGRPPSPPEALLPGPQIVSPSPGTTLPFANPRFTWDPVHGAGSYVFELCADAACSATVERASGLTGTLWQPSEGLAQGRYFWRVTAVAASGLDGYPSAPARLEIAGDALDRTLPSLELAFEGPRIGCGSRLLLGAGAEVALQSSDALAGVVARRYRLDGREVFLDDWKGGWGPGPHRLEATAWDAAGNEATLAPVVVELDAAAPRLSWEVGDEELFRRFGQPNPRSERRSRREQTALERTGARLEWSSDGRVWLPLAAPGTSSQTGSSQPASAAFVVGDRPQLFLRAVAAADPFLPASPVRLPAGRLLRVEARDEACAVERLSFGIRRTATGPTLWLEAVDLLGNAQREEWPLAGS